MNTTIQNYDLTTLSKMKRKDLMELVREYYRFRFQLHWRNIGGGKMAFHADHITIECHCGTNCTQAGFYIHDEESVTCGRCGTIYIPNKDKTEVHVKTPKDFFFEFYEDGVESWINK